MKKLIITVLTHALASSSLPSQQSLQETSVKAGSVHLSLRLPELNADSNMKAGRILMLPWLRRRQQNESRDLLVSISSTPPPISFGFIDLPTEIRNMIRMEALIFSGKRIHLSNMIYQFANLRHIPGRYFISHQLFWR